MFEYHLLTFMDCYKKKMSINLFEAAFINANQHWSVFISILFLNQI